MSRKNLSFKKTDFFYELYLLILYPVFFARSKSLLSVFNAGFYDYIKSLASYDVFKLGFPM